VVPELQRWIEVRQMNLAAPWPAIGRQDVVFCRNVLIYLDIATKRSILRRVRETLNPGGYLFLGAAETTRGLDDQYEALHVGSGGCYRPTSIRRPTERRAS
jgi:chemotaxis protein methyltransferase CheR